MIDLKNIRAIDIHTHAEEPCGCHPDDGYDDLQSTMAEHFRAPWKYPPTVPERWLADFEGIDIKDEVRLLGLQ